MKWCADAIRFIVFGIPISTPASAAQVWASVFDGEPDAFSNQQSIPPGSQASGTVGNLQAVLTSHSGRLELAFSRALSPDNPQEAAQPTPPPSITDVPVAARATKGYAQKLATYRPCIRIGVVLNLVEEVHDPIAANRKFGELVNTTKHFPDSARDLNFQVNVPMTMRSLNDQRMNRVVKWGTSTLQMAIIQIISGNEGVPQFRMTERHLVNLQLDVNTIPSTPPSEIRSPIEAIDELLNEALSITSMGYDHVLG